MDAAPTYSLLADRAYPDFQAVRPSTLMRQLEATDPGFQEITRVAQNPEAPLLVVIHPGDLVFEPYGWGHDPESEAEKQAALAFWGHTGTGLQHELAQARTAHWDIAVLHRSSSTMFTDNARGLAKSLWTKHLCPLVARHLCAWGDDLDAAFAWLDRHAHLAQRPTIRLAGAFACPQTGCITHIGKAIVAARGGPDGIEVSPHSPPGNGPGLAWTPTGPRMMDPTTKQT